MCSSDLVDTTVDQAASLSQRLCTMIQERLNTLPCDGFVPLCFSAVSEPEPHDHDFLDVFRRTQLEFHHHRDKHEHPQL